MSQLSGSDFQTLYGSTGTTFPDNTTGLISEGDMRQFGQDIKDSYLNKTDNFIDEDSFATDSATKVPSQQSVKAYVTAQVAAVTQFTTVTVNVSSADILALNSTPKQIIAAPGAGKFIEIIKGYIYLTYASAYSNTTTELRYGTGTSITGPITTFLSAGVNTLFAHNGYAGIATAFSQFENLAVNYYAPSANPTGGTSTIKVTLIYRIVTV